MNKQPFERTSPTLAPQRREHLEFLTVRTLSSSPGISQRSLAASLGVSLGRTNFVLRGLIGKGFVKVERYRTSKNKRAYLYVLTPSGIAAKAGMAKQFIQERLEEFERLRAEIDDLRQESSL